MGGPPDPVVELFVDQKRVASCLQRDSEHHRCLSDQVVQLSDGSFIALRVTDKDLSENDHIGVAGPFVLDHQVTLNQPILLRTEGQIKRAELVLRKSGQ